MKPFFLLGLLLLTSCAQGTCEVLETYKVRGESMAPLLQAGDTIVVDINQSCFNISRGDVVLYDFAGNEAPILKRVMAVPGDTWRLNGSSIIVNEKILVNSEGVPYRVTDQEMLLLYTNDYPVLGGGQYLLLGNQPGGSMDATQFGLIHRSDILGKLYK